MNYLDEFAPEKTREELAAEEQQDREADNKRRIILELLASDAGKRQLVEDLKHTLPIGGGLFIANSNIYKNTSLADATLLRLSELREALCLEIEDERENYLHYNTADIGKVLLSWFFNIDINDL